MERGFMARKKKYPKLPNGYGSIKHLSGKRRNPFAVYPPATELIAPGQYAPSKAICYVDDYMKGFAVLTAYHAGNYYPGFERTLNNLNGTPDTLLADFTQAFRSWELEEQKLTFREVFLQYYQDKFKKDYEHHEKKTSMENSMRSAYKNCSELHDQSFSELVANDLQKVLDTCPLKRSSIELIMTLFHQMYQYAIKNDICEKDYSQFISIHKDEDDEHGVPFSDRELSILWENKEDPIVEMLLIMCYSGFRISAYKDLKVNLEESYFQGGVKTAAGKDRIVPIHSGIYPLVKERIRRLGTLFNISPNIFRKSMYDVLSLLKIDKHTPHDCRHTFSRLCEKYGVNENDRKRMLGHSFQDITNRVYGHRELKDLKSEIEKIKICY